MCRFIRLAGDVFYLFGAGRFLEPLLFYKVWNFEAEKSAGTPPKLGS